MSHLHTTQEFLVKMNAWATLSPHLYTLIRILYSEKSRLLCTHTIAEVFKCAEESMRVKSERKTRIYKRRFEY